MQVFEKSAIVALTLMPFTQLRVGFIGVGEIIILLLFLIEFSQGIYKVSQDRKVFTTLWITFLFLCILGFLFNVIFYGYRTGTPNGALFDFASYLLVLITCFTFENHQARIGLNYYAVLRGLFLTVGTVFSLLFALSFFADSLFGLPLRIATAFVPLANNVHQTTMFLVPFPFIGLLLIENERTVYKKVLFTILTVVFVIMVMETNAFKGIIGIYAGLVLYFSLKLIYSTHGKVRKFVIASLITSFVIITALNIETFSTALITIFEEEDKGDARSRLYSNAVSVASTSPIFGLGPGPHIWGGDGYWDSHQSILTILLQSGLLGVCVFLAFVYSVLRKVVKEPFAIAAVIPILIYALGGDILRRLPIWIILIIIFYYVKFQSDERQLGLSENPVKVTN